MTTQLETLRYSPLQFKRGDSYKGYEDLLERADTGRVPPRIVEAAQAGNQGAVELLWNQSSQRFHLAAAANAALSAGKREVARILMAAQQE